jgi:hypothetical protein
MRKYWNKKGVLWETMGINRYNQRNPWETVGILEVMRNPPEFTVWYVFTASQHHSMWSMGVYRLTLNKPWGVFVSAVSPALSHEVYWCLRFTLTVVYII